MKKYNVIMITLDGARLENIIKFPNFKNITKQSTFLSKVITYAPYTVGAMFSIFSGSYGNRTGTDNYYGAFAFQKNKFMTLTKYLKDQGYYTFGDILSDIVVPLSDFDEIKVHDELKDDLTERHSKLIEKAKSLQENNKPFFLYLHYSNIHTGLLLNVLKKYTNQSKEYFDNKEKNLKQYNSFIKNADDYLGTIFKKIISNNLIENTLVVIQSDHGCSIGDRIGERAYGSFCYDYTIRAFTIFHQPLIFPATEITKLGRTIDTLPTILDTLKIPLNKKYSEIDGKSLWPLINKEADERYAFIETGNPLESGQPPKSPNVRAIRTSKWKYIKNFWNDTEELYDLEKDPKESVNLINDKKVLADELRLLLKINMKKSKINKPL